jgi:hypothetical protein
MSESTDEGVTHAKKGRTSMYCPQCGATNDDTADTCGACGYDLSKYRQQWEDQDTAQAPADVSAMAAESTPVPGSDSAPGQPPPPAQAPPYQAPPFQPPAYGPGPYQAPYQQGPYRQGPPYPQQPYPRYYQAPPYQPGPYGPYAYGGMPPRIPSYLGWAIAVLILCFWPTGIPAVVFASQVDNKLAMGDFEGARESSRKAKMWCWITFGIAVAGWVLTIALVAIIAIVGAGVHTGVY